MEALPFDIVWLQNYRRHALFYVGRVVRADVLMDDSKRSKGCGTVLFETAEEAAHAVCIF